MQLLNLYYDTYTYISRMYNTYKHVYENYSNYFNFCILYFFHLFKTFVFCIILYYWEINGIK